jgi:outer membrane receptor protein involved in Fe transport
MSSIYLKPLFEKKIDPLTNVLKDIFKENNFALSYIGAFSIALGVAQSSNAFADENIEEVIVTASKRSENLQDLAMSVQAITAAGIRS